MEPILWIALPVLVAFGSAILSYSIMHARMEVAVAQQLVLLAEANSKVRAMESNLPDKIKLAEETAQRRAFDSFLKDFRVEERRYIKESKSRLMDRRSIIMQERLYFRNIPLSNWVEHETQLEDGVNVEVVDSSSVFTASGLSNHLKNAPMPKYLA